MILVGKFGWDRDSSHGPSRRHPGLRLYTSREPQGRAPYYKVHTATQRAVKRAPIPLHFVVLQAPVFACILKFLISAPAVTHLQAELQPLYPVMMMVRDRHGTRAATTAWPSDGAVLLSRALPHSAAERPPRGLHP